MTWPRCPTARYSLGLIAGTQEADRAFRQVSEVTQAGNLGPQTKQDFHLNRFAAYLTSMAGDDTKEAVARARIYFAVRAREAEP